jgi:hypothetical protein
VPSYLLPVAGLRHQLLVPSFTYAPPGPWVLVINTRDKAREQLKTSNIGVHLFESLRLLYRAVHSNFRGRNRVDD